MEEAEYNICEKDLLLSYNNTIKAKLADDSTIICQHIGTFSQEVLVCFMSLIENSLLQNNESKLLGKRLSYVIIESIQNIIYHSNKLPNNKQLAFIIVCKSKSAYSVYTSNTVLTKDVTGLVEKIEKFSEPQLDELSELITKKIMEPNMNKEGRGGIGFLSMIIKSGKNFGYKVSKLSSNYSLFGAEFNIKYN